MAVEILPLIFVNGNEAFEAIDHYKDSIHGAVKEIPSQQLLRFLMDKEWYGIDAKIVAEVIRCPKIFAIPHTPDHIMGVINLRGEILTIIDIRKLLNLPDAMSGNSTSDRKYAVVVEQDDTKVGIVVDKASDLVDMPDSAISPSLSEADSAKASAKLISGKAQLQGEVLAIIDVERLLEISG